MVLTLDPAPSAPSYSNPDTFESDTSNYLAWMKTIRDQLSGQALEIGDKVQSASDTTAGRLLTPGYMGLGGTQAIPVLDLNTISANGFYKIAAANAGSGSAPTGSGNWEVIHNQFDGNAGTQIAVQAGLALSGPFYWRTRGSGTWNAWKRLDPERGSNPNGEWVRLADGTQICTMTCKVDVTVSSSSQGFNFPASFAVIPAVSIGYLSGGPNAALEPKNIRAWGAAASTVGFVRLATSGTSVDPNSDAEKLRMIAVGRYI
ncbi:MAG: pyocin knob domain-containing protein [Limimaricola soesokkakensis]|uniref:pyocin knob domain-containing protein n=1 Tax=Limimaricola soesokkakensis TaxID=1343159 RepID=UPI0040580DE4